MNSPFSPPTFSKTTSQANTFLQTVYFHVGQRLEEVKPTWFADALTARSLLGAQQLMRATAFISFFFLHVVTMCTYSNNECKWSV